MPEFNPEHAKRRAWVLLAIDSCDRAGFTPISKTLYHRLIFLSNCLAELFSLNPPSKRVIKYKRGPFYPDVQWEMDRLNAMGLVEVKNVRIERDEFGPWFHADYSITSTGISTVQMIKATPLGKTTAAYIDELVFAFARLDVHQLESVALHELNYAAMSTEGVLISFDDMESNKALLKTKDFERITPEILATRVREKLQLYLRYIEKEGLAA